MKWKRSGFTDLFELRHSKVTGSNIIKLSIKNTVLQKQTDTELEFYYRDIVKGLMLITTLFKKPRV